MARERFTRQVHQTATGLRIAQTSALIYPAFKHRSMISGLAETGAMLYQKRRIMERLEYSAYLTE
jgi:hypothetical protein